MEKKLLDTGNIKIYSQAKLWVCQAALVFRGLLMFYLVFPNREYISIYKIQKTCITTNNPQRICV